MNIEILEPEQARDHAGALRALEAGIDYPIADGADQFTIDHGPDYTPFFEELGQARFMIVRDEAGRLVGTLAGVWRQAHEAAQPRRTLYLGDLKLAPGARGRGVVPRMLWAGMRQVLAQPRLRGWGLVYGAAMRGARGDVTDSAGPASPVRWVESLGELDLYFLDAGALGRLDGSGAPANPSDPGLDLSPEASAPDAPLLTSTRGRKDYQLASTGQPWRLWHLPRGPRGWGADLGEYLERAGAEVRARGVQGQVCLALDARLTDHAAWLRARGQRPGARCTIHGWRVEALAPPRPTGWTHLAPSQI